MNHIKSFLLVSTFLICQHAIATEYHVSVSGNDSQPGTREMPFKSISAAAKIAIAGDTITVHEGTYREWVIPENGGLNDLNRIVYRAAPGEKVVIKGSEIIKSWNKYKGNTWMAVIPNSLFGDYNPYSDVLVGDWLGNKGMVHHTGEVFLNGNSLFEKNSLDEVLKSDPYPDARNKELSIYTWHAEVGEENTAIWANFQGADPNKEMVEINVRPSCFYPVKPGINYITVSGFIMDQAATQWAAPTAEQIGLIGTHWSKGWIIENNTISNSKCVGITLGKDRFTGQNVWINNPVKDGATHYNEVIFRALEIGWSKEKIGSHIVRNNVITKCGQAGIVGSMGGVFSKIYNNHIYDIWTKRTFAGAEMGGIKIHGSIDMLIENNLIHNTGRGIWIDWMAQGTKISGNILFDNTTDDLFSEVNHGPYMVYNNIFLSQTAIRDWSEGGAYLHNFIAGKISLNKVLGRFTPYHLPHSTKVAGLRNIYLGDNRYMNNIFIAQKNESETINENNAVFYGLHGYKITGFSNIISGNVYYNGAKPGDSDQNFVEYNNEKPTYEVDIENGKLRFKLRIDQVPDNKRLMVTTDELGSTIVSEAVFENPDGSQLILNKDLSGNQRNSLNPMAGPIENLSSGENVIELYYPVYGH